MFKNHEKTKKVDKIEYQFKATELTIISHKISQTKEKIWVEFKDSKDYYTAEVENEYLTISMYSDRLKYGWSIFFFWKEMKHHSPNKVTTNEQNGKLLTYLKAFMVKTNYISNEYENKWLLYTS